MEGFEEPVFDEPGQDVNPPVKEKEANPDSSVSDEGQLVDVVVMGQSIKVTPDAALVLEEREREFNRKLSEHSQELGELRKLREERANPDKFETNPSSLDDEELEELWFTSPKKAVAILKQNMKQELSRTKEEIKKDLKLERAVEDREKVFWNKFYSNNSDLKRADKVVKAILAEKWESLASIPDEDVAQKTLAGYVRAYLAKLVSTSAPSLNAEPTGEPPEPQHKKEEHAATLSELLRRRRQRQMGGIKLA